MASITIRNLDDSVKAGLRLRAARNNRSMEEEARRILAEAVKESGREGRGLGTAIHKRFLAAGGVELEVAERSERPRSPRELE
ncbi:MAG: FitA-like ribbon-helix-helix domain-containing protein [Spirochaetaceae bacterium]